MNAGTAVTEVNASEVDMQIIRLNPGDRLITLRPGTPLGRALDFPDEHPVLSVWRAATRQYEDYDATCTKVAIG